MYVHFSDEAVRAEIAPYLLDSVRIAFDHTDNMYAIVVTGPGLFGSPLTWRYDPDLATIGTDASLFAADVLARVTPELVRERPPKTA